MCVRYAGDIFRIRGAMVGFDGMTRSLLIQSRSGREKIESIGCANP